MALCARFDHGRVKSGISLGLGCSSGGPHPVLRPIMTLLRPVRGQAWYGQRGAAVRTPSPLASSSSPTPRLYLKTKNSQGALAVLGGRKYGPRGFLRQALLAGSRKRRNWLVLRRESVALLQTHGKEQHLVRQTPSALAIAATHRHALRNNLLDGVANKLERSWKRLWVRIRGD